MGTADIGFLIRGIGDIRIFRPADYAADVAGVIKIISCLLITMNIAAVRYISYCTASRRNAYNTANISNIYCFFA